MPTVLLAYYSVAIVAASIVGGLLPQWVAMTHRRTELAVSFVAGAMLGVAMLHFLPEALQASGEAGAEYGGVFRWVLGGFLAMFLIERFFSFHQKDYGESSRGGTHGAGCDHDHPHAEHAFSWTGAAIGLTLHSLLAGVALAAAVRHSPSASTFAGLGAFVAIVLHKPLDAMTIAVLMRSGGWSLSAQAIANGLFAMAVPLGVLVYHLGVAPAVDGGPSFTAGLAFSAGVFLCVSMSDLLPELRFHDHDRIALSAALVLGLGVAELASGLESHSHAKEAQTHDVRPAPAAQLAERNAS